MEGDQILSTLTRATLASLFILCTSSSSVPREANPPQSGSRVLHRKVARTWVNYHVHFLPYSASSMRLGRRVASLSLGYIGGDLRTCPEFEPYWVRGALNPALTVYATN